MKSPITIHVLLALPLLISADESGEDPLKNAFGQDMYCKPFSCSTKFTPVPKSTRPKYTSGGCASMGGGMMMMYGGQDNRQDAFWPCCHQWHACYQVCGSNKQTCDARFKDCAALKCVGNDKCQKGAELKSMMLQMGGCEKYDEAQAANCQCMDEKKAEGVRVEALEKFYKKYAPESMDKVKSLSKKVETSGKFAALFIKLLEKYPKSVKYVKDETTNMYEQIDRMMKEKDAKEKKEKEAEKAKEEYDDDDEMGGDDFDEEKVEL